MRAALIVALGLLSWQVPAPTNLHIVSEDTPEMAIALVAAPTKKTRVNFSGTTTVSHTPAAAGNLLVSVEATFSTTIAELTLSDNQGGGWANISTATGDADSHVIIRWKIAANTNAHTLTWTETGAGSADIEADIVEFSGMSATPNDVATNNTGTSAAPNVASGTLAQAEEVIIAIASHTGGDTTWAVDGAGGYTQIGENEDNDLGQTYSSQYKIVAATTSDQADWALGASRVWFAALASFKGASGGGGPTVKTLAALGVG